MKKISFIVFLSAILTFSTIDAAAQTPSRKTQQKQSTSKGKQSSSSKKPVSSKDKKAADSKAKAAAAKPKAKPAAPSAGAIKTASGLIYIITKKGHGRLPKKGETVTVHYTGTLTNGVKFDSSRDGGKPFSFKLGAGAVIKGWDEGIAKLHVGDNAILILPAALGYGARGAGNGAIPPNASLIFVVELLDAK